MQQQAQEPSTQPYQDLTGGVLVKGYGAALAGLESGDPEAPAAIEWFGQRLSEIGMRDDAYGLAARRTRASFAQYMGARAEGRPDSLDSFIDRDALKTLDAYLVDGGDFESKRRYDLNGAQPQPAYMGEDGKAYVDAGGIPHEIPLDWARANRDGIISAMRGEVDFGPEWLRSASAALGPEGMGVGLKALDHAVRATRMVAEGREWDDVPALVDVPTADPAMPLPLMPTLLDENGEELDADESKRLLQNPVYVRAIKELIAEEEANGALERGVWDTFSRTTGFLVDFALVGKGLGAAGRGVAGAAKLARGAAPAADLAAQTVAAGAEAASAQAPGLLARPAIAARLHTVRDFAAYQITNDLAYGRVGSPTDLAASGLAGVKDAALVLGTSAVVGAVRRGIFGALASRRIDPITRDLEYRLGPVGRAVGAVHNAAKDTETMGALIERVAAASSSNRTIRQVLVSNGWTKSRAQMIEHMIDSAGVGLVFGAYHAASANPKWDSMGRGDQLAELVNGLTSPEALGGAAAFAGSVAAHAYAHKLEWGKEWERAPAQAREAFERDVKATIAGIAQPENLELVDSFREAFNAYRKANPKDFEGVEFLTPRDRDVRFAVEAGKAEWLKNAPKTPPGEGPAPASPEGGTPPATPPPAGGIVQSGPAPRAPALDQTYEAWRQAKIDAGEKPEALDARGKNGRSTVGYARYAQERRVARQQEGEGALPFGDGTSEQIPLAEAMKVSRLQRDEIMRLVADGELQAYRNPKGYEFEPLVNRAQFEAFMAETLGGAESFVEPQRPAVGERSRELLEAITEPIRDRTAPMDFEAAATERTTKALQPEPAPRVVEPPKDPVERQQRQKLEDFIEREYGDAERGMGIESAGEALDLLREEIKAGNITSEAEATDAWNFYVDRLEYAWAEKEDIGDVGRVFFGDTAEIQAGRSPWKSGGAPAAPAAPEAPTEAPKRTGAVGRAATLELPDGTSKPVTYEIVEIDDVTPSHDPKAGFKQRPGGDKNERPYHDPVEGKDLRDRVTRNAENLKPGFLVTDTPVATDGPPIVNEKGQVLGGNARTMAMELAYSRGGAQAERLRAALTEAAQSFGIDPAQVQSMKRPVLVRRIADADAGAPGEMSRILNEAFTAPRTLTADAISRGSKIDERAAQAVAQAIGEGTLAEALAEKGTRDAILQALVEAEALTEADVAKLFRGQDKKLTEAAKETISSTLLGAVVSDVRVLSSMPPSVRQSIMRSLPSLVRAKVAWPEFGAIMEHAVEAIAEARKVGLSVAELFKQASIEDQPWRSDKRAMALAERLESDTQIEFGRRMRSLAESIYEAATGQGNLFGGGAGRTPVEEYDAQLGGAGPGVRPGDGGGPGGTPTVFASANAGGKAQRKFRFPRGQAESIHPDTPLKPITRGEAEIYLRGASAVLFPVTPERNERVVGVAKVLMGIGVAAPEAEAAALLMDTHASVWAAKNRTTPEEWYKRRIAGVTQSAPPGGAPPEALAAATFIEDGRAILHAMKGQNYATIVEELFHVWRRDLEGPELEAVEKWANVRGGAWTVKAEEKFAGAAMRYLRTGKAPSRETQGVFAQAKKFLGDLFQRIRGTGLDVTLPSDVRRSIDSLFKLTGPAADQVIAERMSRLGPKEMGEIYRQNRNRIQYLGMSLEEIVGHELRGGLPDVEAPSRAQKLARVGDSVREAYEILRLHGVVDPLPYEHPVVARELIDLARGGSAAMRQRFADSGGADAFSYAVEAAKRAVSQMREHAIELSGNPEQTRAAIDVAEWLASPDPISPELRAKAEKAGIIRKNGRIDRLLMVTVAQRIQNEAAISARKAGSADRLGPLVAAARPWLAFGISPHEFAEHALARTVKLKRLVDFNKKHKIVPVSVMLQLDRIGAFVGGMWQNIPSSSVVAATNKSAAMNVFAPWDRAVRVLMGRGDDALARILGKFNGRVPPRSHMRLLNQAIESGLMEKMKGPEGFERIQPGTGYLFEIGTEINDVLTSLGQLGVQAKFLAPGQMEKWGGRYRPHLYLTMEQDEFVKHLNQGEFATAFAARNMSRGTMAASEDRLAIEDPFSWLTAVTRQEGKAVQILGTVLELHHSKQAITEAELKELDPYDAVSYVPFVLNPLQNAKGLGNGPALRNWYFLADILKQQLDPADPHPKNPDLARTLQNLTGIEFVDGKLKNTKPPMYVTRQVLWELDGIMSQAFNAPAMEGFIDKAVYEFEQATRAFRRGLTVGRPKHWTLNILNSVGTGHALDRLPMWDAASSFTMGRGYLADSIRDILGLVELSAMPNQKVKPEKWSNEKWERVQLLQEAFVELNGTTFSGVGLEGSVVTDALSSVVTPDIRTAALLEDLRARGLDPESASAWKAVIFDTARRLTGGIAEFDRRIASMMGSHDASERARAMANFTAFYNLWEMAFKWGAALRTIEVQPDATSYSLKDIVRWAAVGTADYANTSPIMRSFNTSYSVFSNPLYAKTDGGGKWARAAMREALRGRFWMYTGTMTPALMSSVATHPLRAATIAALTAGVTGALHSLSTSDPEEDAAWQEAVRGSVARAGEPLLDESALAIYEKMNLPPPNVSGWGMRKDTDPELLRDLWHAMLRGRTLIFQAPNRGDQTRMSSLADVAPGWGNWIGAGEAAGRVTGGSSRMAVDSVLDTMSLRGMELTQALAFGMVNVTRALKSDAPGRGADAVKQLSQAAADIFPTVSPFFLASRDGQRMIEVSALNGQTIDEWARNVVQVDKPSAPANVGEFAFSALWRSQRLVQPSMGGLSESDAMDALIRRVVPSVQQSSGPAWDVHRKAATEVHYQLAEILSGTYEEYLKWGRSIASYDALLVPAIFGNDGPMAERIAAESDPSMQRAMASYLEQFVTSPDWNEVAGQILQLGRRRAMRPDYFRAAISNSLYDPSGRSLMGWLEQKIMRSGASHDELKDYADLFYNVVRVPGPDSRVDRDIYLQVDQRLRERGYLPAYTLEAPSDILRRRGIKPELAGRPALTDAILNR